MFKFIKYELMGRLKLILGGFAALILINLFVIAGFNFWWQGGMEAAFAVSTAIGFLGVFIVAIDSVIIVRRDLYNDTGYLVFTVPQSGYSILGAKLIVGILEIIMFIVFQTLISSVFIVPLIKDDFWYIFERVFQAFPEVFPEILMVLVIIFWSLVSLLLIITFSIVLAKSILNTKRFGNMASFGVFIGISIVIGLIQNQLRKIPWNAELQFSNFHMGAFNLEHANSVINVPETMFMILLPILLFVAAGYLIQNKLEMR